MELETSYFQDKVAVLRRPLSKIKIGYLEFLEKFKGGYSITPEGSEGGEKEDTLNKVGNLVNRINIAFQRLDVPMKKLVAYKPLSERKTALMLIDLLNEILELHGSLEEIIKKEVLNSSLYTNPFKVGIAEKLNSLKKELEKVKREFVELYEKAES